ncbi:MAG: hypothetical protein K0U93_28145 [Gammaproteobacteria bacterium]|nr:hypothetical protein [Gammaproteobacteria bacterium]
MSTNVLYVCTYWGVRSQIAKLLTDALGESDLYVESAGFETGTVGELPRQLLQERGLDLPAESPDTLFKCARRKAEYDYVITLCNQHSQENYSVLYKVVDMLFGARSEIVHWNIPDFMSITASGDERIVAAREIVGTIETEVCRFVQQVRERQIGTD